MKYFINPKGFIGATVYAVADDKGLWFVEKDGTKRLSWANTMEMAIDRCKQRSTRPY